MDEVLVDISVWIDFFNGVDCEQVFAFQKLLNEGRVCLCPTVYQEILQGIKDDTQFQNIKQTLGFFDVLQSDFPLLQDTAVNLYRALRKKGITIRKANDCLIAACALLFNVPVLHKDRDFTLICENSAVNSYL